MSHRSSLSEISKFKELSEMEKENNTYIIKVNQMNNRIKNLKMQQADLNKKINSLKVLEIHKKEFQTFKDFNQEELIDSKIRHAKEYDAKKEFVNNEKDKRSLSLQMSRLKNQQEKQRKYDESRADHLLTQSILTQYNTHKTNVNRCKIVKAKMERVQLQTDQEKNKIRVVNKRNNLYQNKINYEIERRSKLKDALISLEHHETDCFKKLNQTMKTKDEIKKNLSSNFINGIKNENASKTGKQFYPSKSHTSIKSDYIIKYEKRIQTAKSVNRKIIKKGEVVKIYSAIKPQSSTTID